MAGDIESCEILAIVYPGFVQFCVILTTSGWIVDGAISPGGGSFPPFLCSSSFSMHSGHGATLTFNPNGESTQVDWEPLGKIEL